MAKNYDGMAVGAFELDNLVACFVALDAASKAANVTIQSVERNRLKSGACVKIRGSVSDVNAAMEVALETAKPLGKIVSHRILCICILCHSSFVLCFSSFLHSYHFRKRCIIRYIIFLWICIFFNTRLLRLY